jgi:MraZ protein
VADIIYLLGEYECSVDAKGRIKMPVGLKKQFPPSNQGRFVVTRGFEKCLSIYPAYEWDKIKGRLSTLDPFVKDHRTFVRYFISGATELTMDASDRVLIPKRLLEEYGIGKEAVFFANGEKVEIWSKAEYKKLRTMDADEFASLAERVMGGRTEAQEEGE